MTPEEFANKAIELIESNSIKEWARKENNWPHVLKASQHFLDKQAEPYLLTTFLVSAAIGL